MSEKPQDPNGHSKASAGPARRKILRFAVGALLFVMTAVAIATELKELASMIKPGAIANQSMFSIPSALTLRFRACNYHFFFFCQPKPGVEKCELANKDEARQEICIENIISPSLFADPVPTPKWQTIPYVNVILYSFVMLPRLPEATIHMLKTRWGEGSVEFTLGVVFVFAYITLVIVVLRQKSDMKLWYFALAMVYGPYLILGVFWLLQHALLGASAGAITASAVLVNAVGPPLCTVACIGHDVEMVTHVFEKIKKAI